MHLSLPHPQLLHLHIKNLLQLEILILQILNLRILRLQIIPHLIRAVRQDLLAFIQILDFEAIFVQVGLAFSQFLFNLVILFF